MSARLAIAVCASLLLPAIAAAAQTPVFRDQRLFTTAAQRARLDRLRAGREIAHIEDQRALVPAHKQAPPSPVRLEGFVQRSGGPPAVWVNDRNTLSGDRIAPGIRVDSGRIEGGTVVIELPGGQTIRLKPGQTWDPKTGHIHDPGKG